MQLKFKIAFGLVGGTLSAAFGGWDMGLQLLILLIVVDYITGLMLAGIFKKSTKTANGGLSSNAGYKGIAKKISILMCVAVAVALDSYLGSGQFLRGATILSFIINELVSFAENLGLMGIQFPKALSNSIDLLKGKDKNNNDEG